MFKDLEVRIKHLGNFLSPFLLLLIRLYWGYQFAIAGFGKLIHIDQTAAYFQSLGIPLPYLNTLLAGCVEMIGGALLILGLFSRLAAIPLFFVMLVAYVTSESDSLRILFRDWDPTQFFSRTPFLFAYAVVIVFCFGPGKLSLDYWFRGDNKKK